MESPNPNRLPSFRRGLCRADSRDRLGRGTAEPGAMGLGDGIGSPWRDRIIPMGHAQDDVAFRTMHNHPAKGTKVGVTRHVLSQEPMQQTVCDWHICPSFTAPVYGAIARPETAGAQIRAIPAERGHFVLHSGRNHRVEGGYGAEGSPLFSG
ncbi:hypothetical protein GCM10025857_08060 [Alicyclobacillus contaminans]|nr:hypothetical protein GCM10025857_08060 [Alicyclobacillus contaminans]